MLPTTLTTNEVKDASGTEVEFLHFSQDGRTKVYAKSGEAPNAQHHISVAHTEVGAGAGLRRRSACRVTKEIVGASGLKRTVSWYIVGDLPVGDIANLDEPKAVLANLISLIASTGADTVVKFDCTGTAASALLAGSL